MEKEVTTEQLEQLLHASFPHDEEARLVRVEHLDSTTLRVRLVYHDRLLRPGATISGPTMMKLADTAMWLAVQPHGLGPEAVTSSLNIHFLRRPGAADLIAQADILRAGGRHAVGTVTMYSDGSDEPVARATVTYVVP